MKWIVFEGLDGVGKTTQAKLAKDFIEKKINKAVTILREPGSSSIGEKIRSILKDSDNNIDYLTELFLIVASRNQMVKEKIQPLLNSDIYLITDRSYLSTIAYQGYGRGINIEFIKKIQSNIQNIKKPDVIFLLDKDPSLVFPGKKETNKDRFELEPLEFFQKVRKGYLSEKNKSIKIINANDKIESIHKEVIKEINNINNDYI